MKNGKELSGLYNYKIGKYGSFRCLFKIRSVKRMFEAKKKKIFIKKVLKGQARVNRCTFFQHFASCLTFFCAII